MNKNSLPNNITPDRIAFNCFLPLKRTTLPGFNSNIEDENSKSLLEIAHKQGEDEITTGDKYVSSSEYDSGSTQPYWFGDMPIQLLIRDDRYIIKVFANLPKLANGLPHNGRCIHSQSQLDHAIERVRQRIDPYVKRMSYFEVSEIELALNIADPIHVIQSFFWGRNLKGSHQPPAIRPGQAVSMNRDRRSDGKRPELSFNLYDKPVELLKTFDSERFIHLPENVTRLEFTLRGKRIEKEFGGTTLDIVTLSAMQDVFWRLFDPLCADVPTEIHSELGCRKEDILTRMIYQELKFVEQLSDNDEPTLAWWLRSNVEPVRKKAQNRKAATPASVNKAVRDAATRARKQYREAAVRANGLLGRRLSDYVNRETPFVEIY